VEGENLGLHRTGSESYMRRKQVMCIIAFVGAILTGWGPSQTQLATQIANESTATVEA
jgi:hypothetical protein